MKEALDMDTREKEDEGVDGLKGDLMWTELGGWGSFLKNTVGVCCCSGAQKR